MNFCPHIDPSVGVFPWPLVREAQRSALQNPNGHKDVEGSGPVFESAKREGAAIRLHFSHPGGWLVAKRGTPLKGFVICGAKRKFVPAEARNAFP